MRAMGCGAGIFAPRELNDAEQDELFQLACQYMEVDCVQKCLNEGKIEIDAPDCLSSFRDNANTITQWAEKLREMSEAGESGSGITGMVWGAAKAAGELGGRAVAVTMETGASAVHAFIDKFDKEFSSVGSDVLQMKKMEVIEVFRNYIFKYDFKNPKALCRNPTSPNQITTILTTTAAGALAKPMLDIVQKEINENTLVKAWDATLETMEECVKKVGSIIDISSWNWCKIELDINQYIVEKTIMSMLISMGTFEAANRRDPAGKTTKPKLFEACFTADKVLTTEDQKNK